MILSPFVFHDLHAANDVIVYTARIRENILHIYWWDIASFGAADLRTVNHNATFFTLEICAFVNLASTVAFWWLNKANSRLRWVIRVPGDADCRTRIGATYP